MKCASCEKLIRKGTGRRALVQSRDELPHLGIVCVACFATAVPLVVPPPVTIAPPCANCGRKAAKFCADCYDGACTNVRHRASASRGAA